MAKVGRPIGKLHQDDVRKKIQATKLVKVLEDHALNGESELSMSRLRAIEILLKKSIPDLQAVELSGDLTVRTAEQELAELNGTK